MEAVPKLPMLFFELKLSPVCPDFATPFKRFIANNYQEDPDSYDKEIRELEILRNNACRAPRDFTGCSLLKRYYSQVFSLQNRFSVFESGCGVQCVWADNYSGQSVIGDLDFELACVLYNIGALHAELGALDSRNTADSMKVACTHFQCAAWAFETLRDDPRLFKSKDMAHDILSFFVQIMLAQAQECIIEKSMLDNRKASIVAKVAAQVVEYYSGALVMLLQAATNTSGLHTILDIVGSKIYKEWKKFVEFKVAYYNAICSLYMGNLSEEQQKMGERVAWYQSAQDKLNEAVKLSKNLDRNEVSDALTFVADVITAKLNNAKKENDHVYHERVPTMDKLTEVKGVSLVKGIAFSVCDPEICGQDIFARLIPIEAYETASIYSAKKDEIMRDVRNKIEGKNQELDVYMASLQVDRDTLRSKDEGIPEELIDVCASMSVNPKVIVEVQSVLQELEEICIEVDGAISKAKEMIRDEEAKEKEHQEKLGKRPPSMILVELNKELEKHEATHQKAVQSNISLKESLEKHLDDIRLLISSSAKEIALHLPATSVGVPIDETNIKEMDKLLAKVDEMKSQRAMLGNQLRESMDSDDVMKLVLAHPKDQIDVIFQEEIKKYDKFVSLLDQNMNAQENILRALTKANANYAETRRKLLENQRNRKARISSLLHTYEVFQEIKINSKKGVEFYKKFQNIVARLVARIRGVTRVQDEERLQFAVIQAKKNKPKLPTTSAYYFPPNSTSTVNSITNSVSNNSATSNLVATNPMGQLNSVNSDQLNYQQLLQPAQKLDSLQYSQNLPQQQLQNQPLQVHSAPKQDYLQYQQPHQQIFQPQLTSKPDYLQYQQPPLANYSMDQLNNGHQSYNYQSQQTLQMNQTQKPEYLQYQQYPVANYPMDVYNTNNQYNYQQPLQMQSNEKADYFQYQPPQLQQQQSTQFQPTAKQDYSYQYQQIQPTIQSQLNSKPDYLLYQQNSITNNSMNQFNNDQVYNYQQQQVQMQYQHQQPLQPIVQPTDDILTPMRSLTIEKEKDVNKDLILFE